jgi:4-amino-4-deoxy-L-arabinose transferase-like glycosyltransferase
MRTTLIKFAPLFVVLIAAFSLRLVNLSYSDYQGDEIKAMLRPQDGIEISAFLMEQRKGPIQFLITGGLGAVMGNYDNYLVMRLPFALAGSLTIVFFYLMIKENFNSKTAFYSSLFIAINGFFVGLTRIVQYQGFVMLFAVLALYFFSLSIKRSNWPRWGVLLGFISWALSILSHYDGVFIAPFAAYLLFQWWRSAQMDTKTKIRIMTASLLVSGVMLATFYVPFVLSLSDSTLNYWTTRINGEGRISSTQYLFRIYQPLLSLELYIGLFLIFFPLFLSQIVLNKAKKIENFLPYVALVTWLLLPLVFMEVFVSIPGTHIFNYLLPLSVFMGSSIFLLDQLLINIFKSRKVTFLTNLVWIFTLMFLYMQSYMIFVDHSVEYPWREEKLFSWALEMPDTDFYLSIFGFPYNRNWKDMRTELSKLSENNEFYDTNERSTITAYYVPMTKKSAKATVLIEVLHPQSFDTFELDDDDEGKVSLVKEFYSANGEIISRIYTYSRD